MFKQKLLQQEQGFTLVEVLVSILIATVFISVSMQAMVIAAVFKARAKQHSEATTWIQEDLENVKYRAAQLNYATLTAAAGTTATQLQVSSVVGFAVGDTLTVGTDATNNVISSINAITSRLIINSGTPTLDSSQSSGVVVISTNQCNPTGVNPENRGFAKSLQDNLPPLTNSGTKTIVGKTFTLTRTTNVKNVAPYEVLEITYNVTPPTGSAVATIYTEMIPNVALLCP